MSIKLKTYLRRLIPKNDIARGIGVLVGGTAGSQLIMLLAAPIVARLYHPESFGLLAVFTALLTFITVVSCLRYEQAIPLPAGDDDATQLLALALLILIGISGLTAFLVYFFGHAIAAGLGSEHLARYLWLLPIGVLTGGAYLALERWSVRTRSFKQIAKTQFSRTLSNVAIQLIGFKLGPLGLIAGRVAGQGVGCGTLGKAAWRQIEIREISGRAMLRVAHRYRAFAIYSTWTALFNAASLQFAPIVFVALYGVGVTGLYALTLAVLTLPSNLIGHAVGSVFLAHAPQADRDGSLPEMVIAMHHKLAMAGVPVLVLILVAGPELFAFAFGENWRKAGQYAQWMAPWIYLQFQWSPMSGLASILELQRDAMIAQLLTLILRIGALLLCAALRTTPDVGIFVFAVVSAVTYLACLLWIMAQADLKPTTVIVDELKTIGWFSLLATPAIVLFKSEHGYLTLLAGILFIAQCAWWLSQIINRPSPKTPPTTQ